MITVGLIRAKLSNLGWLCLLTYPSTVVLQVGHQVGVSGKVRSGATGKSTEELQGGG